jgi:hypothetical protein
MKNRAYKYIFFTLCIVFLEEGVAYRAPRDPFLMVSHSKLKKAVGPLLVRNTQYAYLGRIEDATTTWAIIRDLSGEVIHLERSECTGPFLDELLEIAPDYIVMKLKGEHENKTNIKKIFLG